MLLLPEGSGINNKMKMKIRPGWAEEFEFQLYEKQVLFLKNEGKMTSLPA